MNKWRLSNGGLLCIHYIPCFWYKYIHIENLIFSKNFEAAEMSNIRIDWTASHWDNSLKLCLCACKTCNLNLFNIRVNKMSCDSDTFVSLHQIWANTSRQCAAIRCECVRWAMRDARREHNNHYIGILYYAYSTKSRFTAFLISKFTIWMSFSNRVSFQWKLYLDIWVESRYIWNVFTHIT